MFVLPSSYHSFWTVVLEKILESPLDCKEIKPVNPKGNQPWIFIGRTDAEAEAPIIWPPDAKKWLTGKETLMLGKTEHGRRRGWQRMRCLDGITDLMDRSLSRLWELWWTEKPAMLRSMGLQSWTRLSNWTDFHPKKNVSLLKVSNSSLKTNIVGICCSIIHPKWSQWYLLASHLPFYTLGCVHVCLVLPDSLWPCEL